MGLDRPDSREVSEEAVVRSVLAMQSDGPRLSGAARSVRNSVFAALQSRIDAARARGSDLVPLQIGDTCLAPPRRAIETLHELPDATLGAYGAVLGVPELRAALASRLRALGHASVFGPECVHVGVGCTHALFCAARALLDPADEVLVVSPYWPLVTGVFTTAGAVPVEVPLTQSLFLPAGADVGAVLRRALSPRTRAVYFSSPSNPDGYVFTRADMEAVAQVALEHDLWVFSDEVYADYVYEGAHEPFANLPGMATRTVTCHSLSKSHALAGSRIGYVSAPERVIEAVRRISNHTVYNVPVAMQRVALEAISTGDEFVANAREVYRAARDAATAALSRHDLPHHVPRGGSFVFVELERRLRGEPLLRALERAIDRGVLVAPGDAFGGAHATSVRICFTGVPSNDVVVGIERLSAALDSLVAEKEK